MNDVAQEYLPANGNGHEKAFRIVRNDQPDFGPINARDRVIEDNTLDLGARLMFVRILDLSTRQDVREHYGAVCISQQKLADKFGVSTRTIWNWKKQLEGKGEVWMSAKPMPNAWPIDVYHVTELDPPGQTEGRTTLEGMWGNGTRRQGPDRLGMGAREPGQVIIPGTGNRSNRFHSETSFQNPKKSSFLPANSAGNRNPLPSSTETSFCGEPKQVATANSNPLPLATETGCEPEPKQVATGNRNPLPLAAETGCEHIQSKSVGNSVSRVGGEALPTEKQFQDWLKSLDGMFASRLRLLETALTKKLALAKSASAKREWQNRLSIVQARLLGGPVEDKPAAKPVRIEKKPTMSFEAQRSAWNKAKGSLPASLKKNAAGRAAART